MDWIVSLGAVVAAYLVGSVSFAVVVSKLFGLADPRHYGSGNPGATNVLRSGNKSAAILTLLGDALKGFVGGYLPLALSGNSAAMQTALVLAPIAAVLGHMFPVFHGFKGGKGVATAAGALFAVDWRLGLAVVLSWIVVAALWRMSSLASIASCALAVLFGLAVFDLKSSLLAVGAIAVLVVWRHSENIGRLLAGTESKIGAKAAGSGTAAPKKSKKKH